MSVLTDGLVNTPEAWSARAETAATSHEAAGWSQHGQAARFDAVREFLRMRLAEQLLDHGCGTGLFSTLVPEYVGYIGYDPAPGMIRRARREHAGPNRSFQTWLPTARTIEHIVCIGCFNLPGGWGKENTWHALRHLWDTYTPRTLIASLYAGTDERCLIYNVDEARREARNLGYYVDVVDDYLPNDLLLAVHRR